MLGKKSARKADTVLHAQNGCEKVQDSIENMVKDGVLWTYKGGRERVKRM